MNEYFLNNEETNIINFFIYILRHPHKNYETTELQHRLGFSASYLKVIYRELEILQAKYKQFEFQTTPKSLNIILYESFSLTDIYLLFFKNTLNYKLLSYLYSGKFHSQLYFSQGVNYSIRTVQRSAQKLQIFLENYSIYINFKKNDPLVGEEFLIRFFFERMEWELFNEDSFFETINSSPTTQEFLLLLSAYLPQINSISYFRILNIFKLSLIRIKNGNRIEVLPRDFYNILNPLITIDNFSEKIVFPFFSKHHVKIDDKFYLEILYLFGIISLLIEYNYEKIDDSTSSPMISSQYEKEIFDEFIHSLELLLGENLVTKDKKYIEYNFVSNLLRFKIFRTTKKINPINFDIETNKKMNTDQIISEKCLKICANSFPNLSDIFLDNLFILRTSSIIRSILPKYTPVVNIAILSKSGNLYLDILKNQLKQFNFGKIAFKDINDDIDLDIIITDYRISKLRDRKASYSRSLICNYPLEWKDIQIVFRAVEQTIQEKYKQLWNTSV